MFKSLIAGAATVAAVGLAAIGGTAAPAWATPQPTGAGKSCADGQLDNCYTKGQMEEFLGVIDDLVLDYMQEIGVPQKALPEVVFVPSGETVQTDCAFDAEGGRAADDKAYAYCPADNTVYIGQDALWFFYQEFGAVGPLTGLAHEYGHFLQSYLGVPSPESNRESVTHENQADCVAGAFIGDLAEGGQVEYPRDYTNLAGLFVEIASAEGPGRDHGTVEERASSFVLGYFGDLSGCNVFYPDAPIAS